MKILSEIIRIKRMFLLKHRTYQRNREVQLLTILETEMFRKMTIQEKLTSVAKLVAIFQADFNAVPKKFSDILISLNRKLNESVLENLK